MSRVQVKKVKVLYNGPIKAKGWVYGPILSPYTESTKIIFAMLKDGINVVEVLINGSDLKLNATNFDKDNNRGIVPDEGLGDDDLFQPALQESENTFSKAEKIEVIETQCIVDTSNAEIQEEVEAVQPIDVVEQETTMPKYNEKKKNKKNK